MPETSFAHSQGHKGPLTLFWLAVLFLVAVGIGLAWLGASPVRGTKTSTGLVIRTIEQGTGPVVTGDDLVLIDYEGRLPNGTVFDSSSAHGGPQPVAPKQTIAGFSEALTNMRKGGTYHVRIPSELAYGSEAPPGIPANSDLEFDIHVVDVAPGAAAMAAQAARQQQQQQQQGGGALPTENPPAETPTPRKN